MHDARKLSPPSRCGHQDTGSYNTLLTRWQRDSARFSQYSRNHLLVPSLPRSIKPLVNVKLRTSVLISIETFSNYCESFVFVDRSSEVTSHPRCCGHGEMETPDSHVTLFNCL